MTLDEDVKIGKDPTIRAGRRKKAKEQDKRAAREAYQAQKPGFFQRLFSKPKPGKGYQTLAAEHELRERGYSRAEAERLVMELKGQSVNHFTDEQALDIMKQGDTYRGRELKSNELVVVLEERLKKYAYPNLIRFRNSDWYPMSIKDGPKGVEYLLKLAR
jgi:hypothetical protein